MKPISCDKCHKKLDDQAATRINDPCYFLAKKGLKMIDYNPNDNYNLHFCDICMNLYIANHVRDIDDFLMREIEK